MISSVDLAHYGVSRAKDWVSVDYGTNWFIKLKIITSIGSIIPQANTSPDTSLRHARTDERFYKMRTTVYPHTRRLLWLSRNRIVPTYSRTSVARTLMARLLRLFRTRLWVPWKQSNSCRFGINLAHFLLYIENGMLCVLIKIASMRRF